MSTISDLPYEVLSKILCSLDKKDKYRCLFVNKTFYSVSVLELWKAPDVFGRTISDFIDCLNLFGHTIGSNVKRITLHYNFSDKQFLHILSFLPNLEEMIIFDGNYLTDKSIAQIPKYCKHLKCLELNFLNISDQSFVFFDQCYQLTRLAINSCQNMTSKALLAFINLPIKNLKLWGCKWMLSVETAFCIRSLTCLTHLDLSFTLCNPIEFLRCITVDDTGMPYLPHLQYFSIVTTPNQSNNIDTSLIPFLRTHSHICHLDLHLDQISDALFKAVACHLPCLKTFNIGNSVGTPAKSIREIVYQCSRLSDVDIYDIDFTERDFPEALHKVFSRRLRLGRTDLDRIRANQCTKIIYN